MIIELTEHYRKRQVDAQAVVEENHLPFSDRLPETLSDSFSYELRIGREPSFGDLASNGFFGFKETETVLDGEVDGTKVMGFYSDFYPDLGRKFSVYGEVDGPKSDYVINNAVYVEGRNNVDKARRKFKDLMNSDNGAFHAFEKENIR